MFFHIDFDPSILASQNLFDLVISPGIIRPESRAEEILKMDLTAEEIGQMLGGN